MSGSMSAELYAGDGSDWDAYVASHPAGTSYHRFGWKQVVERSFGHHGYYLVAHRGGGEIAGVLPLIHMKSRLFGSFLVSVPFFNYGGVLSSDSTAATALLSRAAHVLQETAASHVELRHREEALPGLATVTHKVTMVLDLAEDAASQWRGFNSKLRNQIRKAEKSGLVATVGGSELLPDFYQVFARNMRDLGTPVYSRMFFNEVMASLPEESCIVTVYLEGKPVAAGLLLRYRDVNEIPWASSIRDYNALCPNNLLYWTALQHAIGTGSRRFDFGRSTPGEGTYKFKEQWGARPLQLNWQYLLQKGVPVPALNNKNPKFQKAIRVWQKLPLQITNVLGPHIVRNIP